MESHTAREGDDMNEATTVTRTQVRDPICGMDVDPATAAYRVEHDGMTYYFCGARCAETFQRDPQAVLARLAKPEDRKSVVEGKSGAERVDVGGRRNVTKKTET